MEKFVKTREYVNQFADSHPRFDELGDVIEFLVQRGFSLETAYATAVNPPQIRREDLVKALTRLGVKNAKQKRKAGAHHASGGPR